MGVSKESASMTATIKKQRRFALTHEPTCTEGLPMNVLAEFKDYYKRLDEMIVESTKADLEEHQE